MREIYMLK